MRELRQSTGVCICHAPRLCFGRFLPPQHRNCCGRDSTLQINQQTAENYADIDLFLRSAQTLPVCEI